jgi:hypothetical protein
MVNKALMATHGFSFGTFVLYWRILWSNTYTSLLHVCDIFSFTLWAMSTITSLGILICIVSFLVGLELTIIGVFLVLKCASVLLSWF